MNWLNVADVFICHASEDKTTFVAALAKGLREAGMGVWYDDLSLKLGDSLRRAIDRGLKSARFGIVILSKAFFEKRWPQYELDGLVTLENSRGTKVILPIWHEVSQQDVEQYSPSLAGRYAAMSSEPLERIVARIIEVVQLPRDD